MYKTKYFKIEELVPQHVHAKYGEFAWAFLDDRLLRSIDALREKFGPVFINTWHSESLRKSQGLTYRSQSGFRTAEFYESPKQYATSMSQHKFGRATDLTFRDCTTSSVSDFILSNPDSFPDIRGIEVGKPWLHVDVRNSAGIMVF